MRNKARVPVVMVSEIALMAWLVQEDRGKKTQHNKPFQDWRERKKKVFSFTDDITGHNANPRGPADIVMY